jgi:chemotaxis family two-component system response regulator Rcp1
VIRALIKVLLVEDNPGEVVLVREALKEAQLTFDLAIEEDGESMLPRVGGLQLLERMRKSSQWAQVPIVIASSSDSPKDRQAAAAIGVSGYFRKPFDYEQFMEVGILVRQLVT